MPVWIFLNQQENNLRQQERDKEILDLKQQHSMEMQDAKQKEGEEKLKLENEIERRKAHLKIALTGITALGSLFTGGVIGSLLQTDKKKDKKSDS